MHLVLVTEFSFICRYLQYQILVYVYQTNYG